MHETLIQQLIRHFGSLDKVPENLKPFLEDVDRTYSSPTPTGAGSPGKRAGASEFRYSRQGTEEDAENGHARETMAIPIHLRGQKLGAINLSFDDTQKARETAPLIEQLTGRLALAMDNARLFSDTQVSLARTNALFEISRAAINIDNAGELLQRTAGIIQSTLDAEMVTVYRIDTDAEQITEKRGFGDVLPNAGYREVLESPIGAAVKTGEAVVLESPAGDAPQGAALAVPLRVRSKIEGLFVVTRSPTQPDFQPGDVDLLTAMTNQISTALENTLLVEEQERRLQQLTVLFEGSRIFATAPADPFEAARVMAEFFIRTTGADDVGIGLYLADEDYIHFLVDIAVKNGENVPHPDPTIWDYSLADYPFTRRVLNDRQAAYVSISDEDIDPAEHRFLENEDVKTLLILPMFVKGETIGVIELEYHDLERAFSAEQLDYYNTLANQAAATLDNLQLLEAQQARTVELQTAAEVSQAASSILDPEELLTRTVELIRERFDLYYAGIFLNDDSNRWAVLRAGTGEAGRTQLAQDHRLEIGGRSMIGRCVATGQAQIALDIGEAAVRFQNPVLPDTRSEMALPLISRGQTLGAMTIQSTRPAAFSDENITTLRTMADQLANAIENARLFEQAQLQNVELDTLNRMGRDLAENLDRGAISENIYRYTSRLMDFDSFLLAFYNEEMNQLEFSLVMEKGQQLSIPTQTLGEGLVAYVIRNRTPLMILEDLEGTAQKLGISYTTVGQQPQAWLGVPMFIGDQVVGVISVQSTTTPYLYSERHRDLLISIANQASSAVQISDLFAQAQTQADELAVLNEMSRALSIQLDVDAVIESIYGYATQLLGTPNLFIAQYDTQTDRIDFKLAVTDEGDRLEVPSRQLGDGLTDYVIHTRKPLLFKDNAEAEIERMGLEGITIGDPPLSWLAVPIVLGETVIGVIGTQSVTTPGKFTERHQDLLVSIAGQAAISLQNANLFNQSQRQNEELLVLNEMSRELVSQLNEQDIVETIYRLTGRLLDSSNFFVAFFDEKSEMLTFPLVTIGSDGRRIDLDPRPLGNGLTDYVIRKQEPLLFERYSPEEYEELGIELMVFGDDKPAQSWLGVPMLSGGRSLGIISVQSTEHQGVYNNRHRELLTAIANQAVSAVQNARSFALSQRQNRDLLILNEMSGVLSSSLSEEEVVVNVYDYASRVLDTTHFHMVFYDQDAGMIHHPLIVNHGERLAVPAREFGNRGIIDHIITTRKPVLFEQDVQAQIEALGLETVFPGDEEIPLSWVGVPMLIGSDVIGTISVQSTTTARLFGEYERDLLSSIAGQAAIAVQNARLFGEAQRRASQLQTAAEVARDASESLNLDELLPRAVNLIRDRFGFYHASIFLLDEEQENAYVRASTGDAGQELIRRRHMLPVGSKSIIGSVTHTGDALVVNDVTRDVIHRPNPLLPETRAELGIPLKVGERVIGALDVQSTEVNAFPPDAIAVLQTLSDQIAVAVDNSRTFELAQEAFREARERAHEMSTLYDVGRRLSGTALEVQEIAETAITTIADTLGEDVTCSIDLYDEESGWMRTIAGQHFAGGDRMLLEDLSTGDFQLEDYPAIQQVMDRMEIGWFRLSDDDVDPAQRRHLEEADSHTQVIVPLIMQGVSRGILKIDALAEHVTFTQDQIDLVSAMANQAAGALANALLYVEQRETAEQLRELDQLKNLFLANMSHELRTPLNSIIGFSRVILKGIDGPISDLQRQDLNAIYTAGQHLLGLINDILDLSRIEAGKMELNFEDLEIEPLINSVMATARGLVKEKTIRLEHHVEPDLPMVYGDATRVRQVLLNLLQNAAKFTEEGYIRVSAGLDTDRRGIQHIRVSVEDSGIGIAPEDQAMLFQPFTQVDSSTTRRVGGTGLGLSISRNLIDLHGGDIGVESTVGEGSHFYFTLPVRQVSQPAGTNGDRKIVLAIDDDARVLELYERYLDSQGYQVIGLQDPSKAVEQAVILKPFAITLDVMMPSKNGWQVIQELKSNEETRAIPVIFCTIIEDEARGFSLGASDYLLKPILEEDLLNALNRVKESREIHKVLVVDDDPEVLRLVEKILKPSGVYDLVLAEGGRAGLTAVREEKPDVVLLDLLMDDMDGFQVLETMQADEDLCQIPVIVVTGYEMNEAEHKTIAAYANNLIRKGDGREVQLVDKIDRILQAKNSTTNGPVERANPKEETPGSD